MAEEKGLTSNLLPTCKALNLQDVALPLVEVPLPEQERFLAVQPRQALAGLLVDVPAELGGDHHLIAERRHALAEDALDLEGAIGLGESKKVTPLSKAARMMFSISGRKGTVV